MAKYFSEHILLDMRDKDMNYVYDLTDLEEYLAGIPTADVQEVRHGKWVRKEPEGAIFADYECSVCSSYPTGSIRSHYCPNCGAKMDGEE